MPMTQLHYTLRFTSPAFLGNAEQNAQWRTPPIKALLRQWWRVVYAADRNFNIDIAQMRHAEGLLFGHAWLENDRENGKEVAARKSELRLRLSHWQEGQLNSAKWPTLEALKHPEVPKTIASDLYLGYGPVKIGKPTTLKARAAIQAGETGRLSVAVSDGQANDLTRTLALISGYATLGGRSRNGWGSFELSAESGTPSLTTTPPLRNWREALKLDWPHAIGMDSHGAALIWTTTPMSNWQSLMVELAKIKIGLRTQFAFNRGAVATPQPRHWLSYPVTRHAVQSWPREYRLPNSLRFKVRLGATGQPHATIFHLPCSPPTVTRAADRHVIEDVWQQVYGFLDDHAALKRAGGTAL